MPTVHSKFHPFIDEFMLHGTYSMFIKSFTLFKYLCIDNNEFREFMFESSVKPWREPTNYPVQTLNLC